MTNKCIIVLNVTWKELFSENISMRKVSKKQMQVRAIWLLLKTKQTEIWKVETQNSERLKLKNEDMKILFKKNLIIDIKINKRG